MATDVFFLSDTDDLDEGGTNLYFTEARARDALFGTGAITYDSSSGEIGLDQGLIDHGAIGGLSDDDHPQYVLRSTLTANGDLFTRTAGVVARLAVGGANTLLGVSGGLPAWVAQSTLDHGSIGGLSDDDHPQYLLAAGTRALSANWDAGSFQIRAETFQSDVTTGTAPLTVASTTKVANLNADKLDDQEGSYYLDSANFTGTNWTDLTDAGATTLHKHDHGGMDGLADDDHTQYHTDARALTWLGTRSTSDLAEGTNLYFTNARADARIAAQAGVSGGLATLDGSGKIPTSQLPALAITVPFAVSSQAAMLALSAEQGDIAIRSDLNKSFILSTNSPSTLADWLELLTPTDTVLSVNGQTGAVTLTTTHIGEGSNLYFTDERVDDRVASLLQNGTGLSWSYNDGAGTLTPTVSLSAFSTSNLAEGSNLYYTDERVDDRVASLVQNGTGISWSYNDGANTLTPTISLASFSTSNLAEGSNLYFTDERAQDAVGGILTDSSTIDFTYNDGANTIAASVIQSATYGWTGAHTWGIAGTGVDLLAHSNVSGDLLQWDVNGGSTGGGVLILAGNAELNVVGRSAFGQGTIGGSVGHSLIHAVTDIDPGDSETGAAIEFTASLDTANSLNGLYGFQMVTETTNTVSSLQEFAAFDGWIQGNHTSGTSAKATCFNATMTYGASGGTTTRAASFRANVPSTSGHTITHYYGLYIPSTPTAATNNWNLWFNGGNSHLGGDNAQIKVGASDDAFFYFDNSNLIWSVASVTSGASFVVKDAGIIWNEDGGDKDTRGEGDTLPYMFFMDASSSTENIALLAASAPNWQSMDRGIFIGDCSAAPSGNPSSGGFLYVESGALKYRGSGGLVTTIAAAA